MPSPWTAALLRWMKRTKLSGLALANQLDVSPSVVSYWRRGSIPREAMLLRIEKLSAGAVKASAVAKKKLARAAA